MVAVPHRARARTGATPGIVAQTLAPFEVAHFGKVYLGGFLWSVCRWALGFLAAYLVNQRTGQPRLVQLTGTMMWGPLLFGGLIGGAVADRFERRRIVLAQFGLLLPLVALVGLAARADALPTWVIFPFMVTIGVGWVMDMTARRALVYDLVGPEHVNGAMALEQFSSSIGLALGAMAGGAVIGALGIGAAYLVVAAIMAATLAILWRIPRALLRTSGSAPAAGPPARPPFLRTVAEGFAALPSNPRLVSILGVTLVVNVFHFAYFPIVTVIAKRVDATPFLTGLLAAATGFGMATGSLWVAMRRPARGPAYVIGSFLAFAIVLGFALFEVYALVFAALYLASAAVGAYGGVQSSLVLTACSDELRGRAMGLLSMAIGGLPVGMYLLGETAQHIGAPAALTVFNITGFVVLAAFLRWRPEAYREV
ncbi:MAG: MFS transporter [Acidimicrobiia bacterium]|nr:MFS transporter [Acidimicrobiia bacterium]